MRAGEPRALQWEDVDREHGRIHVHRASTSTATLEKSTESGTARRIPIEPPHRPLLESKRAERYAEVARRANPGEDDPTLDPSLVIEILSVRDMARGSHR